MTECRHWRCTVHEVRWYGREDECWGEDGRECSPVRTLAPSIG